VKRLSPESAHATRTALAELWLAKAAATDVADEPDAQAIAAAASGLPTTLLVLEHLRTERRLDDAAKVLLAQRRGLAVVGRDDVVLRSGTALLEAGIAEPLRSVVSVAAGGAAYNCYDERADELLAAVASLPEDETIWQVFGYNWLGVLHADAGDAALAQTHAETALASAAVDSRPQVLRRAHSAAAWIALKRGDYVSAATHARAQIPLVSTDGDRVLALLDRCLAELFQGSTTQAEKSARQALRIALRIGPSQHLADARQFLSWALVQAGDPGNALEALLPAMTDMRTRSDPGWLLTNVAVVGLCAFMLDASEEGSVLLQVSNDLALSLLDAPSALPEPLMSTAARLGVQVEAAPDQPPGFESVAELVERAIHLGEALRS